MTPTVYYAFTNLCTSVSISPGRLPIDGYLQSARSTFLSTLEADVLAPRIKLLLPAVNACLNDRSSRLSSAGSQFRVAKLRRSLFGGEIQWCARSSRPWTGRAAASPLMSLSLPVPVPLPALHASLLGALDTAVTDTAAASDSGRPLFTILILAVAAAVVMWDMRRNDNQFKEAQDDAKERLARIQKIKDDLVAAAQANETEGAAFWDYGAGFYRRIGDQLVRMQVRHLDTASVDPNVILYCCWTAAQGFGPLTRSEIGAAVDWGQSIERWKNRIAVGLNVLREKAPLRAPDGSDLEEYEAALERARSEGGTELLEELVKIPNAPQSPPLPTSSSSSGVKSAVATPSATEDTAMARTARHSLQEYFAAVEVPVTGLDREALRLVLGTCFPAAEPKALLLECTGDPSTYEVDAPDEFNLEERIRDLDTRLAGLQVNLFSADEMDTLKKQIRSMIDASSIGNIEIRDSNTSSNGHDPLGGIDNGTNGNGSKN